MNKSDSIKNITEALVKFQSSIASIKKDGTNPFFKSKYATLENIVDSIQKPLAENGLALTQFLSTSPLGDPELTTTLLHTSGEYISASFKLSPIDNKPQSMGGAITYARRYAISSVLRLVTDDDDDGNVASGNTTTKKPASNPVKPVSKTSTKNKINFLIQELGFDPTISDRDLADEIEKMTGFIFIPENHEEIILKLEKLYKDMKNAQKI